MLDWSADPTGHWGSPVAIPMLWGAGTMDHQDATRLSAFRGISHTPPYIIGPEEPDCSTYGSAGFDVSTGEFGRTARTRLSIVIALDLYDVP
jgi:hypothetical protein